MPPLATSLVQDSETNNQNHSRHKDAAINNTDFGQRGAIPIGRTPVCLFPPLPSFEFFRQMWISEVVFVQINQVQPQSVFHLALA